MLFLNQRYINKVLGYNTTTLIKARQLNQYATNTPLTQLLVQLLLQLLVHLIRTKKTHTK